ncbi:hypothetical protein NDU88_002434 [Pleurodeles waltl]|uniref:Reverse transcriptase zinc-binding domain-containing protein n=1 Tax=Pleurodeles waltl TaxID=8319 RepID=A0AAV7TKK1_PLEWA|nr:hypothetical protein NDU88_002434 [Pleurodeles waltl]
MELFMLGDLYEDGQLLSFSRLQLGLPSGQFLLYNSLLRALRTKWGDVSVAPPMHLLTQYLHVMGRGRRLISWFAGALPVHTVLESDALRMAWEEDTGISISETHWSLAIVNMAIVTYQCNIPRNSRFCLIQFYIVHRAYLTLARVNKYFARQDAACPRCCSVGADLLHMLWSCPSLCSARRVLFT